MVFGKENSMKIPRLGGFYQKKRLQARHTKKYDLKEKLKNSFMSFIEDLPAIDFIVMVGPGEDI